MFNGVPINHGGYGSSLLVRDGGEIIYSLTDRGPNVNVPGGLGFGVPTFTPQIGVFERTGRGIRLIRTILLKQANGTPLTGLPHPNAEANRTEVPKTLDGQPLPQDELGLDSEGLARAKDGSFWISDEYGPDILHVDRDGTTITRLTPGNGLPKALARRRSNRGMEGLTITPDGKKVVGIMQSPLDNPTAGGSSAGRTSRLARIVVVDLATGVTRQYPYLLEAANLLNSEIAAVSSTRFLVLERDGNFPDGAGGGAIKKVYQIDLTGATDISDPQDRVSGLLVGPTQSLTLEEFTKGLAKPDSVLRANGVVPVAESLVVDILAAIPDYPRDKVEGLAVIDNFTIAISNDDDFGVGDDGAGHFIAKTLPSHANATDFNGVSFIRLTAPLGIRDDDDHEDEGRGHDRD